MAGRALTAAAIAIVAAVLTATASAAMPVPGCSPARRSGRFFVTLPVGGVQRSALVTVPRTGGGARPLPMVLAFHGAGGTGPVMETSTGLTRLGERAGFVAVYPTSHTKFWNVRGGRRGEDDVAFVRALIDALERRVCVDPERVYATGVSNGGGFVTRVACELSDRVVAIAAVAGIYGVEPPCHPARPVSVLEIHGTADTTVPYRGGGPEHVASVRSFVSRWRSLDACPRAAPPRRRFAPGAWLDDTYDCAGGTTVAAIELVGGVHAWPGAWSGPPRVDVVVSATRAVWDFFRCQGRPASGRGCPAPQR